MGRVTGPALALALVLPVAAPAVQEGGPDASGAAEPDPVARALPAGLDGALELEHRLRAWALGRDGDGHRLALVDADPRVRRAALEALGRRLGPREADLALLLPALDDPDARVAVAACDALARAGGLDLGADPARTDRLAARSADPDPALRAALAWLAGRLPAELADGVRPAALTADLERRLPLLEALAADPDPGVAGAARRGLLTLPLPPAEADTDPSRPLAMARADLLGRRLAWLDRVATDDGAELLAAFEVLARRPMDPAFGRDLAAWALARARTGSPVTGLSPTTFLGLVEALRLAAGDAGDAALAVGAYADWLLAPFPDGLDLDASRRVDQLFERGAEADRDDVARHLLDEAAARPRPAGPLVVRSDGEPGSEGARAGDPATRPGAWTAARLAGRVDDDEYAFFCRELFARLVAGRTRAAAFAAAEAHGVRPPARPWLLEQFTSGIDAADLAPDLEAWLETTDWFAPAGRLRTSADPWTHLALVEAVGRRHAFHPTAASERLLVEGLAFAWDGFLDVDGRYPMDAAIFESAWSSLCAARDAAPGPEGVPVLGPERGAAGEPLLDGPELYGRLWAAFERFWRGSPGVRIDLLTKLPRVPAMSRFRPILQLVGDQAGVLGTWRSGCVELLGACRGDAVAETVLTGWLDDELAFLERDLAVEARAELERIEDVELLGYARALGDLGPDLGAAGLERLFELVVELGGGAFEAGKATLAALAGRPGGLERLDAVYLAGTGEPGRDPGWRRHRVEAALLVLGRVDDPAALDRAVGVLLRDYTALGWDLRTRVVRTLGTRAGDPRVEAFLLALVRSSTEERPAPAEVPGLVGQPWPGGAPDAEVLAALELAAERPPAAALALLSEAATGALDPSVRGAALARLGDLLVALAALDPTAPEVAAGQALLEGVAFGEATADLSDDERHYLTERALEALARFPQAEVRARWTPRAVFEGALAWSGRDLVERWREGRPGSTEFAARTPVAVWAARAEAGPRDGLLAAAGPWWRADGRFLLQLADSAEEPEPHLAAGLLDAARVALEAEPWLDGVPWARAVTRRMGLAWRGGDWATTARLATDLLERNGRGLVSDSDLQAVLGPRAVQAGRDPVARLEALVLQARARAALDGGDPGTARRLADRAAAHLGASAMALLDQERLEADLP